MLQACVTDQAMCTRIEIDWRVLLMTGQAMHLGPYTATAQKRATNQEARTTMYKRRLFYDGATMYRCVSLS